MQVKPDPEPIDVDTQEETDETNIKDWKPDVSLAYQGECSAQPRTHLCYELSKLPVCGN